MIAAGGKTQTGSVTLVVDRSDTRRAKPLSWVFQSEVHAMAMARALKGENWMVVRGAFANANEALTAARHGNVLQKHSNDTSTAEINRREHYRKPSDSIPIAADR